MKNLPKNAKTLNLNIEFIFKWTGADCNKSISLAKVNSNDELVNKEIRSSYTTFVLNIFEIITYYDFQILDECDKVDKVFPCTEGFKWTALRSELDSTNTSRYIHLKMSESIEELDADNTLCYEVDKGESVSITNKSSFVLDNISVNSKICNNHSEALHEVEYLVRNWLNNQNIDMAEYDVIAW